MLLFKNNSRDKTWQRVNKIILITNQKMWKTKEKVQRIKNSTYLSKGLKQMYCVLFKNKHKATLTVL